MDIVLSGNINPNSFDPSIYTIHKVLRPGYTLYVGTECNDGRPIKESWHYKQALKLGIPIVHPIPSNDTKQRVTQQLLVDKYAPSSVKDIIGHKEQIGQIQSWLQSWEKGYPEMRGVLITGPPGIGKTTTVHLIAKLLGYHVVEYNASDTRSISVLRGMIALGIKRLRKELIVMDEVDGLSERGGVGEIASLLKKTCTPIICIANEKPPKLRPIINACLDIKFQRPMKATIANALLKIIKEEGMTISKIELEQLCEVNGNDIRSILNKLEFYGKSLMDGSANKDSILRMDLFSATQQLFRNKHSSLDEAANLVFVDYNMVPLMVQEAYLSASSTLEEAMKASEFISFGDIMEKRIHVNQEWGLTPDFVQCSVAATKSVSGFAPFQLFPQWLGKNSKRLKHVRYMNELSDKFGCDSDEMRLDYVTSLQTILLKPLTNEKPDIKKVMNQMEEYGLTRDDVMENLTEVCLESIEIPTKVKTAFTREYNKANKGLKESSRALKDSQKEPKESEDEEEDEEPTELEL